MARYCLETHGGSPVLHRVECSAYDLGTLLGLGCVVDVGEYATAAQALEALGYIEHAVSKCPECCQAQVLCLPVPRHSLPPLAITAIPG